MEGQYHSSFYCGWRTLLWSILSSKPALRIKQIEDFVTENQIAIIDDKTSKFYGKIKAQLKADGTPIPENDIWIAALAMQHKVILITRDKHFNKPKGLTIKFW